MLRTLARTCVIILVAIAVAGALYLALAHRDASLSGERLTQADAGSFDDHVGHGRGRPGGRSTNRDDCRGREEMSLGHGLAGVVGTALQVGLLGAVVVGLQKGWQRHQRRRPE